MRKPGADWRVSSFCGTDHVTEQCVRIRLAAASLPGFIDIKDEHGDTVQFTREEIKAFFDGVKAGEFDDLT